MLMANRLQILYLVLIMPMFLVHPYMIWAIVAFGILSQVNLVMLSKWFASGYSAKGYQGFVELFGERTVRFFAFAGLFLILIKIVVFTSGYVEIIHKFIFPSMEKIWLILFILLTGCYVAAHGMENTIRFVVTVFISSAWIIVVFIPFLFPPVASLYDLYPLIPTEWSMHSWKALLFSWSCFSGPEYLICLVPWLNPHPKMLKYLAMGNAISVLTYSFLFLVSLLFFGSNFLSKISFPIVHMIRYLHSDIFERIDMILISIHLFNFVFAIAIFLLCFYGAARIILGRVYEQTTRIGFMTSCITIFICMAIVNEWFWKAPPGQNIWVDVEIWSEALTYFLIPAFLLVSIKRKGRI